MWTKIKLVCLLSVLVTTVDVISLEEIELNETLYQKLTEPDNAFQRSIKSSQSGDKIIGAHDIAQSIMNAAGCPSNKSLYGALKLNIESLLNDKLFTQKYLQNIIQIIDKISIVDGDIINFPKSFKSSKYMRGLKNFSITKCCDILTKDSLCCKMLMLASKKLDKLGDDTMKMDKREVANVIKKLRILLSILTRSGPKSESTDIGVALKEPAKSESTDIGVAVREPAKDEKPAEIVSFGLGVISVTAIGNTHEIRVMDDFVGKDCNMTSQIGAPLELSKLISDKCILMFNLVEK